MQRPDTRRTLNDQAIDRLAVVELDQLETTFGAVDAGRIVAAIVRLAGAKARRRRLDALGTEVAADALEHRNAAAERDRAREVTS